MFAILRKLLGTTTASAEPAAKMPVGFKPALDALETRENPSVYLADHTPVLGPYLANTQAKAAFQNPRVYFPMAAATGQYLYANSYNFASMAQVARFGFMPATAANFYDIAARSSPRATALTAQHIARTTALQQVSVMNILGSSPVTASLLKQPGMAQALGSFGGV